MYIYTNIVTLIFFQEDELSKLRLAISVVRKDTEQLIEENKKLVQELRNLKLLYLAKSDETVKGGCIVPQINT